MRSVPTCYLGIMHCFQLNLTFIENVWYSFGMGLEIVSHDQALIEYLDFRLYFNTVAVPSLRSG